MKHAKDILLAGLRQMSRIALVFGLILCVGCSSESEPDAADRSRDTDEVEEGGGPANPDRDRAEAYFGALNKVTSAEEEKKLLSEFGEWLRARDYKISVRVEEERHFLSCPYFPPVTPWTFHSFLDPTNLELLPLLEEDG